ncbi:UDP-N-acetylmuramate dehydrogenase [Luteococcus peritonei]|uniref:UDP-N-acetylenolpyruvoylglucosamine reductase n=1 Tax=Luteococcus peritonei TaxID=88874 RepID=A0ABW4RSK7_9ACTN
MTIPIGGFSLDDDTGCDITHVPGPDHQPERGSDSPVLAEHTTFRLGGPARRLVVATSEQELLAAVREADAAGETLLVLSGGSNLLVADEGFEGTVVKVATRGIRADVSGCGGAVVTVAAGEPWDDFVAYTLEQDWSGLETLSGIPGLVGSTPIQNVGAYGSDVSQVVYRVRTLDRVTGEYRTFTAGECDFSYRDSVFKRTRMPQGGPTGRYVVLEVVFQLELASRSIPIRYAELARRLGVEVGERSTIHAVREAVLELRRGKGMVSDPTDHDTWSAGSFFTNPVLTPEQAQLLPPEAPRFDAGGGMVKSSAAWLIDHAGFAKGFGQGPARLSTKHTLALTNRGGARTADVVELARRVRDGVEQAYGVVLEAEPVLVGCSL